MTLRTWPARPDRKTRRRRGKSDPIDAEAAVRAVQADTATGIPKARTGRIESIRALRVARRSAMKARSHAALQMHWLVSIADDELRDRLRRLTLAQLVTRASRFHLLDPSDPRQATKTALRSITCRYQQLTDEIHALDAILEPLVAAVA